jgi:hypothetical protein
MHTHKLQHPLLGQCSDTDRLYPRNVLARIQNKLLPLSRVPLRLYEGWFLVLKFGHTNSCASVGQHLHAIGITGHTICGSLDVWELSVN